MYRSHNQGETWQADPMGELNPISPRMRAVYLARYGKEPLDGMWLSGFCNLSDGTSVTYWHQAMVEDDNEPTQYISTMWLSPNGGTTWNDPVDVELTGPANVFGQGHEGQGPALWRRSVQLDNGDLITVVVCRFEGDKKFRVTALGSSDKGHHWRHLATVAHDETINTEGFTEPIICKLADEELICFMRTQGHQPMYQSYSRDGGKTWTKPVKSGVDGVAPDMQLLSNGVLVCSYGRPGANIMFGADGAGRKWTDHTTIYAPVPPTLRGRSTYYTSFEEVSPGRLFLVFDVINYKDAPNAKPANCIRGVYIDVQRVK